MSLTTTITETLSAVDAEIATLTEELQRLDNARNTILALIDSDTATIKVSRATKKSRSNGNAKRGNRGNANGTKREQILDLLDRGVAPKVIAERLDTNPNYVYNVRRDS